MKKRHLLSVFTLIILIALCFTACDMIPSFGGDMSNGGNNNDSGGGDDKTNGSLYCWYDADGALLHEEKLETKVNSNHYQLPADNEKWDYIEWKDGENKNEFVAYRIPQNSYFVGNVFQIIVKDLGGTPIATGSAFVFNSDGWFVTNAHVMEDAYYAQAIFNIKNTTSGESFTYLDINKGSYYHLDKDLYIGKIDNYSAIKSHYKEIPTNITYDIGETTYSVGYPLSSTELIIKEGNVTESWSDLYEKLYSGNSYICSSSYIAPGSSGGILVNDKLEVIGITTLGWTDNNDKFISGAAISAFNFNNLLQNPNDKDLISLQERFHSDEKVYIGYFNEAKDDCLLGVSEKFTFEDGTVAYRYVWKNEGVNSDNNSYLFTETLTVSADGWMSFRSEYYWGSGERRTLSFYGFYDNKDKFDNFTFEFRYEFNNGNYWEVFCDDINYSPTISLTLNKCQSRSNFTTLTTEDINYAKDGFNNVYEWLISDMARFE